MAGTTESNPGLVARTTTISPEEAAERLGVQPSTLSNWRHRGEGPPFVKLGGRVRYRAFELAEWLDAQVRRSTAANGRSGRNKEGT